jgi:hypothetical protein
LQADEIEWNRLAIVAANELMGTGEEYSAGSQQGKDGYAWILGGVYAVFGPNAEYAVIINLLAGMSSGVMIARVAELIGVEAGLSANSVAGATRISALMIAVSPVMAYWQAWVLRETLTVFAISLVALCLVKSLVGVGRGNLVGMIFGCCLIYWLRSQLALAAAAALVGSWVVAAAQRSKHRALYTTGALVPLAAITVVAQRFAASAFERDSDRLVTVITALSENASSGFFDEPTGKIGLAEMVVHTGPRVLAGPFPWEWRISPSMVLGAVEGFIWLLTLILAVLGTTAAPRFGAYRGRTAGAVAGLWTLAGGLLCAFTVTLGNYGIVARMRPLAWCCLVPIAAYSIAMRRAKRSSSALPAARSGRRWPVS